jgi:hypothetical protein
MVAAMELEFEEKQGTENGSEKMNEEPRTGNLVDTTDCLEAVSVIRCWKNFLFIIILLALLLVQGSFWMVNLKVAGADQPAGAADLSAPAVETDEPAAKTTDKIKQAAKKVAQDINSLVAGASEQPQPARQSSPQAAAEPNQLAQRKAEGPLSASIRHWFHPRQKHISAIVRFLNFVLVPGAMLYCLTMLFSLKVSLIGRLGGINHIARAFFLSLLFLILLLPWQLMFAPVFAGAMFTPSELIAACQAQKTIPAYISFYLRFTVYWLLVLLLLLFAQIRSMRWARATLKRLEVI